MVSTASFRSAALNGACSRTFWGFACALLLIGCKSETQNDTQSDNLLVLDSAYQALETIGAVAHCSGPTGPYVTQVYSSLDGETHFRQVYSNRSYVFEAILETPNSGFMLDYESGSQEPLPEIVVLIVRGHEFHKILCFPETYFEAIRFREEISIDGRKYSLFSATDPIGKIATLTYDPAEQHLTRLEFTNPVDTSELIEVIANTWILTEFGRQVSDLDVVQARKDTFSFVYDSLSLNDQWVDLNNRQF